MSTELQHAMHTFLTQRHVILSKAQHLLLKLTEMNENMLDCRADFIQSRLCSCQWGGMPP